MTTIPFVPDRPPRNSPGPHGRLGAGETLLWPGGPATSPGHGGRAPWALPVTGDGVGVGRGVGWGVGCGVGLAVAVAVGAGVGVRTGVAVGVGVRAGVAVGLGVRAGVAVGVGAGVRAGVAVGLGVLDAAGAVAVGPGVGVAGVTPGDVDPGVGVGPPAVIGPSLGCVDPDGATEGSCEDPTDGEGPVLPPPGPDASGTGDAACDGVGSAGLALARATPPSGPVGVTNPAVSATVARMRFRSPMATTRRAR